MAQWNANLGAAGQYYMSVGDDTIAVALATTMTTNVTFKQSGGLGAISTTFSEYATDIVARNANLAATQETNGEFARSLTRSLQEKSDNVRGVNLDEEMSTLILFQQAYSAAARVVNVIQRMFEALDRAVA
jgi:flagellar hook-associated protein 1 FlgK